MSNFNLEEHLKFVEDVKNNPELYKPVGGQIYCSPNGEGSWRNQFCPDCSSGNGIMKVIGNRIDKKWNECLDCGWKGGRDDTSTYEEHINFERYKKIKDILYETI